MCFVFQFVLFGIAEEVLGKWAAVIQSVAAWHSKLSL